MDCLSASGWWATWMPHLGASVHEGGGRPTLSWWDRGHPLADSSGAPGRASSGLTSPVSAGALGTLASTANGLAGRVSARRQARPPVHELPGNALLKLGVDALDAQEAGAPPPGGVASVETQSRQPDRRLMRGSRAPRGGSAP